LKRRRIGPLADEQIRLCEHFLRARILEAQYFRAGVNRARAVKRLA
jgi:hypothetical protein